MTKMVLRLNDWTYEDRLKELNLLSLEQRERQNMIAIYKLMIYKDCLDREELPLFETKETRGCGRNIKKRTCRKKTLR